MANHKNKPVPILISAGALRRLFGIQVRHMEAAQVYPINGTTYDLNPVLAACGVTATNHLQAKTGAIDMYGDNKTAAQLKAEKTVQEVRKLEVENDVREGKLVRIEDVTTTYSKLIKALTDRLDAIPSRVKVAVPDISQHALDTIQRTLVEARNASAMETAHDGIEDL